ARRVLAGAERGVNLPVSTVFFGGGTPTLLPPSALGAILRAIDAEFGLAPGAEVTTEANPESVDQASLSELRSQGLTRISFGMQSAVPAVLAVLDRAHRPGRPAQCAAWARAAGFEHVSLDLIYGTPGESDADWRRSLDAAVAAAPDHVSAYALTVETGTRLAARVRRGELDPPDDDVLADRYLAADEILSAAGYGWYEISNWASSRPSTPRGWRPGTAPARPGRSCPRPNGSWSASCCSSALPTAVRSMYSARPARRTRRRWSPTAWPTPRPWP